MDVKVIGFQKDNATQVLLGYAGITEPYEDLIYKHSLGVLRESSPKCEIQTIEYVRSAGSHPKMRAGGMPIEEGSSKITLQDMTMPFDLLITIVAGKQKHLLKTTFIFECKEIDVKPKNTYTLEIHEQTNA